MIRNIKETDNERFSQYVRTHNKGKTHFAFVNTFGCQQNEADSEKIRAMAIEMGYELTENPEKADFIVLNTCAIREHAEKKALSILGRFKALKANNPNLIVGLCGCMAAEGQVVEKIKKSYPFVSFTVEPNMLYKIPELVALYLQNSKRNYVLGMDEGDIVEGIPSHRASHFSAWVSIMYGCNNFCSYCIVPYVRGRERSRESQEIIEECRNLIKNGYKEITLLGQNVNSYKSDMDFATLLMNIANIEGDFIIRFMTSHPKDVSDSLMEVVGKYSGKIAPCFHLPLQSGSDAVLKAMNRTYDTEKYLNTVEKLRSACPGIALTSDIIVGFPGESEEDFQKTLEVLKKVRFDMVYSFIYSSRAGTRAEKMENHVPRDIQSERIGRLLEMQTEISYEMNLPYIDTVQRVLVHKKEDNLYTGRTLSNKLVHINSEKDDLVGKFINVKIDKVGAFYLTGLEK